MSFLFGRFNRPKRENSIHSAHSRRSSAAANVCENREDFVSNELWRTNWCHPHLKRNKSLINGVITICDENDNLDFSLLLLLFHGKCQIILRRFIQWHSPANFPMKWFTCAASNGKNIFSRKKKKQFSRGLFLGELDVSLVFIFFWARTLLCIEFELQLCHSDVDTKQV